MWPSDHISTAKRLSLKTLFLNSIVRDAERAKELIYFKGHMEMSGMIDRSIQTELRSKRNRS